MQHKEFETNAVQEKCLMDYMYQEYIFFITNIKHKLSTKCFMCHYFSHFLFFAFLKTVVFFYFFFYSYKYLIKSFFCCQILPSFCLKNHKKVSGAFPILTNFLNILDCTVDIKRPFALWVHTLLRAYYFHI